MHRRLFMTTLSGIVMIHVGCDRGDARRSGAGQESESLPKLGAELGVQFPPSTQLMGVKRYNGMDDAVLIKLEIAGTEFPSFMAQTRIDPAAIRPGTRGLLGQDEGFWDPHQSPSLRTGQISRPDARAMNVGFDDSRGDVVVVYVMEHGT